MKTTITKVASLDVIASAMDDLYVNQVIKKAEDSSYQTGLAKLKEKAEKGYQPAKDMLAAIDGTFPHENQTPFRVNDPTIGLNQQEAYAIAGALEKTDLGPHVQAYQVDRSQMNSLEQYMGRLGDAGEAPGEEGDIGDVSEIASIYEDDGNEFASTSLSDVGNFSGDDAMAGAPSDVEGPEANSTGPLTDSNYKSKRLNNSLKMIDVLQKVANTLGENGFELSEMVTDELIESIVNEAKEE